MKRFSVLALVLPALGLIQSCQSQAPSEKGPVIARVSGHEIYYSEVGENFPKKLAIFEDTLVERRMAQEYLDSLVLNRLLIRAAYETKLDQDREINILVDQQRPRFMIDELYKMVVLEKAEPSQRELKDHYKKSGEQRHLKHILVKEKSEAEQIYRDLKDGADFDSLAKEKSTDTGSKSTGGDLGLVNWGVMVDPFQQVAWKLKAGEISHPVETNFGWHIIQLVEIKKLEQKPFEEIMEFQKNRIQMAKQGRLTQDFLKELQEKSQIKLNDETYKLLVERDDKESKTNLLAPPRPSGSYLKVELFSEDERGRPVATYKGGEISIVDFVDQYNKMPAFQRGNLNDRSRTEQVAFQLVLGDLLEQEAKKRNVESRKVYKENVLTLKEALMADKMLNDFIYLTVKVTADDLQKYFDEHPQEFHLPEMVKIQEIQVATQKEATDLLARIRAGGNMNQLASQYTLRSGMKPKYGIFDSLYQTKNPPLFNAVAGLKKGQLTSPVPMGNNFSVIKLLERRPARQPAFQEVQSGLRQMVYDYKKKTTIDAWTDRRKQIDKVEVYPEIYFAQLNEQLEEFRGVGNQTIQGTFPMKVKVGPGGKVEKVED
ncbi:MAG: peptidyl-prolyl cis-trans isomerase [candidate division Zixibacteria bacterium]|nr:peptidyl-prolyl cis-trans isomerase [candidate division Zixibacteria bacterium]